MFQQERSTFDKVVQPVALGVFVGLLVLLFLTPSATGYTWTVVVPLVPIFIVIIGYNRWRNICPLAWFAKLGQGLNWFKRRRVPVWFERNLYLFQFSLLALAFALRLFFLNSNALYLALFFILVIVAAFTSSLFLAGKSWCNFFCPVSLVEKIYCGTNAHLNHLNSACVSCCACKKDCPDIDMENAYWKEDDSKQKHLVFYAFPGLVFGFYFSYFSQSGNWEYYFSGRWTQEVISIYDANVYLFPGLSNLIVIPLVLATCTLLSLAYFLLLEKLVRYAKWMQNKDELARQHIMRMVAAFVAFNIFYIFAGAPAYLHFPTLYMIFHFLVVVVSVMVLYKEVFREEKFFLQERFARNMLQKWSFDSPAPKNLKEIYYTYANHKQDKKNRLESYEQSVNELMKEGVLKLKNMSSLDGLRKSMGISESEHLKVINSLEKLHPYLFDESHTFSAEKSYQLKGYRQALSSLIESEEVLPKKIISNLQKEFRVNDTEHELIYKEIVNNNEHLKSEVYEKIELLKQNILYAKALTQYKSKEVQYLIFVLREKRSAVGEKLFKLLNLLYPDNKTELSEYKNVLFNTEDTIDSELRGDSIDFIEADIREKMFELFQYKNDKKGIPAPNNLMQGLLGCDDDELLSAILLASYVEEELKMDSALIQSYETFKNPLVKEMAMKFSKKLIGISTVEMMSYLHSVKLFKTLDIDDLYDLAGLVRIKAFKKDEPLVVEGEKGDSLFIITSGEAIVLQEGKEIARIKDGDYTGEIALITGGTRIATVKAIQDLECVELLSDSLNMMIMKNPELSLVMMKEITKRLIDNQDV